jgi:acyl-CoA synthetase (AMP-forming)/AMP-acid ligase II
VREGGLGGIHGEDEPRPPLPHASLPYDAAVEIEGPPLAEPAGPLDQLLHVGLAADPNAVAIESVYRRLTWAELEAESARLAAGYLSLGLQPGDRLASLMPNRVALVVHYLACFKAGLVATPLNYRYTAREIDHALSVSDAAALVAHAERAADLSASQLARSLRRGTVVFHDAPGEEVPGATVRGAGRLHAGGETGPGWHHRFDDLLAAEPLAGGREVNPHLPAAIFFTSGSTGPAKGVTHTGESLRWMVASAVGAFELRSDDVFLPASSMSHLGSVLWTLSALAVGGRVVVARTTDAHEILPLLRDHQPTLLAMLPAALWALIHDHSLRPGDFSSLRLVRSGSDKVSTELLAGFTAAAGFPIVEGYGMTEVGLATLNPVSKENRQGSIGTPIGGFTLALRDDQGDPVAVEQVGRIFIKTPSLMSGYWEEPKATARVVSKGWLDSGDLARADQDGYLWFFGRKKQVIVHDGSNVSPFEVEGALVEHPAVDLAGVVGVHDQVHGENVRAYVTLRDGAERPAAADLIRFCRERVGYKAPEEVVFLNEMPLNSTGKIDRVGLKRMAEDHLGLGDPPV